LLGIGFSFEKIKKFSDALCSVYEFWSRRVCESLWFMALAAAQKVKAQPVQLRARVRVQVLLQELVLKLVRALALLKALVQELARVLGRLLARGRVLLRGLVLKLVRALAQLKALVQKLARVLVQLLDLAPESLLVMQRVRGPPWKHLQALQEQRLLV
jgi:hypothetical protein